MDQPSPQTQRPLLALVIRLGAIFVLSAMLVFVKLAGESGIHLVEALFWRQLPTTPMLLIWFAARGSLGTLKTTRLGTHAKRALYGMVGMFCTFGAVLLLPLAEATIFGFTAVFWAVILSALMLREEVGIYRWAAVLLGFVGVVVIAQPGGEKIPILGATVALAGAFMIALISIQIRDLTRTEDPLAIVFYFSAFSTPLLALAMPKLMTSHTLYEWSLLGGLALCGLLGQFLLTAALRYGSVSSVIVMDYSNLIWATLFGWLVFAQLPPATTWLGVPLIIAAGLVIAWREHKLARQKASSIQGRLG